MIRLLPLLLPVLLVAAETTMPDARPYVLSPATAGLLLEDVWPPLPVGAGRVAEIARKERACPWAAGLLRRMRAEARELLRTPAVFPAEPIGWRHDFFSRVSGEHLVFEAGRGDAFLDPLGGARESLPAQHRAWMLLLHERQYRLLRGVALLARLDGDAAMSRWVIDGLTQAAAFFARADLRRNDGGFQAQYYQILYDAAVVSLIADAWSCVRDRADAGARAAVEGMLAERVPVLTAFIAKRGTHNMSAFVAMALAQAAAACARPEWAGGDPQAMVARLLKQGLPTAADGQGDGLWFEGTTFYHFYTACALIGTVEGARATGAALDPAVAAGLQAMLQAPVTLADAQLRMPLFGDFGNPRHMGLAQWRHLYEWGAGRLDPAIFAPILATLYAGGGVERRDLAALAYGPDALPAPGGIPTGDTCLPVAGVGVLRAGGPDGVYAVLRCGSIGSGHDHPDRLSLLLTALGRQLSPDLGEPGYSLRQGGVSYQRTTAAHNTLFADEAEQTGAAELAMHPGVMRGTMHHDGVDYVRTVWLDRGVVVVLDTFAAEAPHRFGWIHHAYGAVTVRSAGDDLATPLPAWPERVGWRDLANPVVTSGGSWSVTWQVDAAVRLELLGVSDGAVEVTAASAPGNPWPDRQGVMVLRAPGTTRRIASVFMPCRAGEAAPARTVALSGDGVRVGFDDGERTYAW